MEQKRDDHDGPEASISDDREDDVEHEGHIRSDLPVAALGGLVKPPASESSEGSAAFTVPKQELSSFSGRMATAIALMRREYAEHLAESGGDDLEQRLAEDFSAERCLEVLKLDPTKISWAHLACIAAGSPDDAKLQWAALRRHALDEVQLGQRSSMALEGGQSTPFERAQFLALREELGRGWNPQSGIEQSLIDQMALAFSKLLECLQKASQLEEGIAMEAYADLLEEQEKAVRQARSRGESEAAARRRAKKLPPRMSAEETLEKLYLMADRWQRMFLRTQRALRDMRRFSSVTIQSAGQVNVAAPGGQQVNVNASQGGRRCNRRTELARG